MSYSVDGTRITLTRGDSLYIEIGMKRGTQTYTPAEGDKVRFALKSARVVGGEYANKRPLILKDIPTDTLLLHLEPSDTKPLPFGDYVYDVELTYANGDVDTFITEAPFVLTREVH